MITTKGIVLNEELRTKIESYDDEYLFRLYIPELEIGKRLCSPLRKDDTPSFSVFVGRSGRLMYHDFKTGDSGDIIKFVCQMTGLLYYDAMRKILRDTSVGIRIQTTKIERKQSATTKKEIKVITRQLTDRDISYWESHGVLKRTLSLYKVYSLEAVFINDVLVGEYRSTQPIYGYYFGNGEWKIYKPYSLQRFYTNTNKLQGYDQLPETGELLVISKSLKDVMLLRELGYFAVAPHSESVNNIDEIDELKTRFKRIVIWYDNDEPGALGAEKLSTKLGLPYVQLPTDQAAKDISDYYKANGFLASQEMADKLLWQNKE